MAKKNTVKAKAWIDKDPVKSYFVHKHGINVYPVSEYEVKKRRGINDYAAIKSNNWYIEVDNNGVRKMFQKVIKTAEINDSVWATINHYYKLLNDKK